MCTALVAQEILDVLHEFVSQEKLFTAFDVTTETRNRTTKEIYHNDTRRIVGTEFNLGQLSNYNRQLVTLDVINKPKAIVYYPDGADPYDYPLAIQDVAPPDDEKDVKKATAKGRLNIPKKILSQLSPMGGTYDIEASGKMFYLKPNADGRVRVSARKLGISNGKCKINVVGDTIQVVEVQ